MRKSDLTKTLVKLDLLKKKKIQFFVYHNLPDTQELKVGSVSVSYPNTGLSLENAVDNWVNRTKSYTAKSLCDYIKSKDIGHTCITEEQYKKLK